MSLMTQLRVAIVALLCTLLSVLAPTPAHAQDADAHFNEGMKQMAQQNYDAACDSFKKSETPAPTVASRYQLGRCNELRGRYASSHQAYLDAAEIAEREGDHERARVARKRATELEEKIPLLHVAVGAGELVEGLTVVDNGEPLARERWNKPIMVDPGSHQLGFSAPGYQSFTVTVEVNRPKEVARVQLPPLARASNGGASGPRSPSGPAPGDSGSAHGPTALFWVGVGLTAGGGLFALLGGIDLALCAGECSDGDLALPVVGLVLGGALLAVGIPFMVVGRAKGGDEPAPVSVEALVSPTSAGVRVRF